MFTIEDQPRCTSEKILSDDTEKGLATLPGSIDDVAAIDKLMVTTQASGEQEHAFMDLDHGIVGWESAEDPENPQNWSPTTKWTLMTWVILMSTFSPTISSICAPGTSLTMQEFGEPSRTIGTLMISIYILGYAVGPLFLAPLSELYGRPLIINCSSAFFNVFLLGCSFAPNMPSLIIMRLFAGVGGSAIMTIVSACIGDVFPVNERATASAIVIGTPSVSPVVGPIIGGFISQYLGWRWTYWIMVMATVPLNILMFLLMKESNHLMILEKKTAQLRKELDRHDLRSSLQAKLPPRQLLARSLVRPLKFIFKSPIIFLIGIYVSTIYGTLYSMFTTIPDVFQDTYHFQIQYTGLAYLGLGIGMFTALALMVKFNDKTVVTLREKNNGVFEPEIRLTNTIFYAPFIPISLFVYGWTARASVHWAVPCLSFIPFGFGLLGIFVPCQTYAADAFPSTAASAVAALVFMRSIFGAFLPLIGPNIYERLGLGWGNTLLGVVAVLITPVPFAFLKWGGTIRKRWVVDL